MGRCYSGYKATDLEALAVWLELTAAEKADYDTAKKKIVEKMAPANFVSLEHFRQRKIRPGESPLLYVYDLLGQAMAELPEKSVVIASVLSRTANTSEYSASSEWDLHTEQKCRASSIDGSHRNKAHS